MICLNYWIKPLPFQCSCPNLSQQLSNLHSLRYSQYSFKNRFIWPRSRLIWRLFSKVRSWWFFWVFLELDKKFQTFRKISLLIYSNRPSILKMTILSYLDFSLCMHLLVHNSLWGDRIQVQTNPYLGTLIFCKASTWHLSYIKFANGFLWQLPNFLLN